MKHYRNCQSAILQNDDKIAARGLRLTVRLLRFQERKFDFYKLKDFDEAIKTADRILENCDYTEDHWMSFALQF